MSKDIFNDFFNTVAGKCNGKIIDTPISFFYRYIRSVDLNTCFDLIV